MDAAKNQDFPLHQKISSSKQPLWLVVMLAQLKSSSSGKTFKVQMSPVSSVENKENKPPEIKDN